MTIKPKTCLACKYLYVHDGTYDSDTVSSEGTFHECVNRNFDTTKTNFCMTQCGWEVIYKNCPLVIEP